MPKGDKLLLKQERFVKEYVKTKNATEAADRVYETKSRRSAQSLGSQNLSKLIIKQAVDNEFKKEDLTVEYVLKGLKEEADQEKDKSIRVRSLELIGKYLKMFTDVTERKDTTDKIPKTPEERKKAVNECLDRLNDIPAQKINRG